MPEEQGACPGASELEDFHEGLLSEEVARRVEQHVAQRGYLIAAVLQQHVERGFPLGGRQRCIPRQLRERPGQRAPDGLQELCERLIVTGIAR